MGFISQLHQGLSNTAILFFLAIGLWGLWRGFRGQGVDGSYLGAMAIGELVFIAQAVLGTILVLDGLRVERMSVHVLYGMFALVFLPGVFFYLQGDDSNRAQWAFAFVTLFLAGIASRGITTAGVG